MSGLVHLALAEFLSAPGIVLDVRSPAEYNQGQIPGAISFPLFSDSERSQVGTCYKQQGRDAAVELGFAIAGHKFAQFIADAKRLTGDRQVRVHCWRGGMRSGAVAWVLNMAGFQVSTLIGGYKAFRHWALTQFALPKPIVVLGGMTGTGKTDVLAHLKRQVQVLDLEALASHRGSSFGALGLPPQPTNEQFENEIAVRWAVFNATQPVWIEAESKRIGRCRIPDLLFEQMEQAPVLEMTRPKSERLAALVSVYGAADRQALIAATERIQKKLGGLSTQQAIALIQEEKLAEAFDLILNYYDKTYSYALQRRSTVLHSIDVAGLSASKSAEVLLKKQQEIFFKTPLSTLQTTAV